MRYANALAMTAIILCGGVHAGPQSGRGMAYQSPFNDYRTMESTEDPSAHWEALNEDMAEPKGHVDLGTHIDEHAGSESGAVRGEPPPQRQMFPQQQPYMKHIVHQAGDDRHHPR